VPAHDEEELVGRCVRSLLEQTYPRSQYRVAVVADNCSDGTAAAAPAGHWWPAEGAPAADRPTARTPAGRRRTDGESGASRKPCRRKAEPVAGGR
jgi:hypothetical protein